MHGVDPAERMSRLVVQGEARFRVAFRMAIESITHDRATLGRVIALIEGGRIEEAIDLLEPIPEGLREAYEASFRASAASTAAWLTSAALSVEVRFDQTNARAVRAMERNSLRLVREFSLEQRRATRQALLAGIEQGLNPRDQARLFRQSIGLTARQEAAVRNFGRMLTAGPGGVPDLESMTRRLRDRRFDPSIARAVREGRALAPAHVARMVERYRERYIAYRSRVISRTEALRSVHQGTEEMYEQAIDNGHLGRGEIERTWVSAGDRRVRHSHNIMNGQVRGHGEPFLSSSGPIRYPGDPDAPASETIQCRCVLTTRIVPGRPNNAFNAPPDDPIDQVRVGGRRFRPHRDADEGRLVLVDTQRLDDAWRIADPTHYLPPGVRRRRVEQMLQRGDTIEAPYVGFVDGTPGFQDGRHRFATLRDRGFRVQAITVDAAEAEFVERAYGVGERSLPASFFNLRPSDQIALLQGLPRNEALIDQASDAYFAASGQGRLRQAREAMIASGVAPQDVDRAFAHFFDWSSMTINQFERRLHELPTLMTLNRPTVRPSVSPALQRWRTYAETGNVVDVLEEVVEEAPPAPTMSFEEAVRLAHPEILEEAKAQGQLPLVWIADLREHRHFAHLSRVEFDEELARLWRSKEFDHLTRGSISLGPSEMPSLVTDRVREGMLGRNHLVSIAIPMRAERAARRAGFTGRFIDADTPIQPSGTFRPAGDGVPVTATQVDEPFHLLTPDGPVQGQAGDWIAVEATGERRLVTAEAWRRSGFIRIDDA